MTRIEDLTGTFSQRKLAQTTNSQPGLDIIFTPRGDLPMCNQTCNGCYYFSNYESGAQALTSAEVPALITGFRNDGYQNFYLISSEILLAPNWEELLRATGDKYINTNGRIIAARGTTILDKLSQAGVDQIVITANITSSHQDLNLTPRGIVDSAFQKIKQYNTANPDKAFTTIATAIITSENYGKIEEMADYVHDEYGADGIKFLASLPLGEGTRTEGNRALMPTRSQLTVAIEQINEMRKKYGKKDFYIQRGGTVGSSGLSADKLKNYCPAGDAIRSVRSMAEGAAVIPCIFIPQVAIGHIENGKIVVDESKLNEFLDFKARALEAGDCPAYALVAE